VESGEKGADAKVGPTQRRVGQELRVLDYIDGQGQVLGYLHQRAASPWIPKSICHLPHGGMNANSITGLKYADHLRDAEFQVEVIKNQGADAAAMRIEAVRRILPKVWFNESTTEAGRDALGFYREQKDEARDVGLVPSLHGAGEVGALHRAWA
jgi:phage terminase large subunit